MQEFDELGEDDVRKRLAAHIWSEEKERLARDWLDMRASAQVRVAIAAARDANDSAWRSSMAARTGNWIAAAALVVAVIALVISIFK
jgi:hypothetical protein